MNTLRYSACWTVRAEPEMSSPTPATVLQPVNEISAAASDSNTTERLNISTSGFYEIGDSEYAYANLVPRVKTRSTIWNAIENGILTRRENHPSFLEFLQFRAPEKIKTTPVRKSAAFQENVKRALIVQQRLCSQDPDNVTRANLLMLAKQWGLNRRGEARNANSMAS